MADWDDNTSTSSSQKRHGGSRGGDRNFGSREWTNSSHHRSSGDNSNGRRENYNNRRNDGQNNRQNDGYNNRQNDGWNNRQNDDNRNDDRNSRSDNRRYDDNEGMTIYVRPEMVGKVIGRGGSKIRELQEDSGARINIDKSSQGGDAAVRISGSEDSQARAKQLIEELTSDQSFAPRQTSDNYSRPKSPTPAAPPPKAQERDALDFGDFDWTTANEDHAKFQEERWKDLKPMIKNFYSELPEVRDMSDEQVAEIRAKKNNIETHRVFETEEPFKVPNPVTTFQQAFHNYPEILDEIKKVGFEEPSPIQSQAWPILLSGRDMIGIAQTGTGKTLAFLLPALIHIDGQPVPRNERVGPNVLIMAPTRELAQQISKEVSKYEYRGIKAACLYGGGSRQEQMAKVDNGVQVVIATPGRLNDLVACGSLSVKEVTYLVLDEADRMLDMGFEPQIRKTLLDVRPDRQTIMTSATWPQGVRRLAQSYMSDPIQVCVGSLDLAATHTVKQTIIIIPDEEKTEYMRDFFNNMQEDDKVIVFFGRKTKVDDIGSELALAGVSAQSIHGGRDQYDREQALEDIKAGQVKILLATDLASRGIDIHDITHVFNYDFPRDIEEYVHRVGRTGRAGRTGESISLFTRGDWAMARPLIAILEEASQEVPEELYKMADRYEAWRKRKDEEREEGRSYGGGGGRGGGRQGGGGFGGGGGRQGGGGFGGGGGGRQGGGGFGGGGGGGGGGRRNRW